MYGEPYGYGATTEESGSAIELSDFFPVGSGIPGKAAVEDSGVIREIRYFRVTNSRQMQMFMDMVCGILDSAGVCIAPTTIPGMAKSFGTLKAWAKEAKMPELVDAITQAAKWFWENVEKPFLKTQPKPKGSIPGLPPTSSNPAAPLIQKPWYPYAVVGTLVVGTGLFIAYRKKKA